jgi:hypothetical protein
MQGCRCAHTGHDGRFICEILLGAFQQTTVTKCQRNDRVQREVRQGAPETGHAGATEPVEHEPQGLTEETEVRTTSREEADQQKTTR